MQGIKHPAHQVILRVPLLSLLGGWHKNRALNPRLPQVVVPIQFERQNIFLLVTSGGPRHIVGLSFHIISTNPSHKMGNKQPNDGPPWKYHSMARAFRPHGMAFPPSQFQSCRMANLIALITSSLVDQIVSSLQKAQSMVEIDSSLELLLGFRVAKTKTKHVLHVWERKHHSCLCLGLLTQNMII